MSAPRGYMTLDEVQEYLGHSNRGSTSVWLTRHGVEAQRVYRRADVVRARAGREPQVDQARVSPRSLIGGSQNKIDADAPDDTSVTSTGVSRTAHGA